MYRYITASREMEAVLTACVEIKLPQLKQQQTTKSFSYAKTFTGEYNNQQSSKLGSLTVQQNFKIKMRQHKNLLMTSPLLGELCVDWPNGSSLSNYPSLLCHLHRTITII